MEFGRNYDISIWIPRIDYTSEFAIKEARNRQISPADIFKIFSFDPWIEVSFFHQIFLTLLSDTDGSHHITATMAKRLNLDEPRYDQSTFSGRAKHFFVTTNPLNVLASDEELDRAKQIVTDYRQGTLKTPLSDDEIWKAKELYDSAFHPQTGEKVFVLGRMSFQVPGNMLITGCMLTFYRSTPAVVFWQTVNQTFNAIVNYSNRNASVGVSNEQLGTAYVAATTASVATALGFNKLIASSPKLAGGIVGRLVPLLAVAAANCVNIPLMRQQVRPYPLSWSDLIVSLFMLACNIY